MNGIIRKTIYGEEAESAKILTGEKLIANNPVIDDKTIILNTNDEFTVERYTTKTESPIFIISDHPDAEPLEVELKYYETEVSINPALEDSSKTNESEKEPIQLPKPKKQAVSSKQIKYTVKAGDNLTKIAKKHHVSVSKIKKAGILFGSNILPNNCVL